GSQNYNLACTFDGRPSVALAVFQLPGTNALDVADRVKKRMGELKGSFPEGVEYEIAYDTTPYIRESVLDVVWRLLEAVGLVAGGGGGGVFAELAGGADPAGGRARGHRRHLRRHGRPALQPQQHLPVRPGAGHRHRRGRRHRRGGERRALAGARPGAPRGG